jgi:SAM-dependent methyltransferase
MDPHPPTSLTSEQRARVDDIWGSFAEGNRTGDCYMELEYVTEVYQKRPYPAGTDHLDAARALAPGRFGRALVLGCGRGDLERAIVARDYAQEVVGVDLSSRALEHARTQARSLGIADRITYLLADLNDPLPDLGRFDAVFAPASLHHVAALESLLDRIHSVLAPDGLLMLAEYVGPTRFQWPARQKELAAEALPLIPPHYRRLPGGGIKESIWAPTVAEVTELDPTEAVRSEEILPLVAERFRVLRREDTGGGLLFPLLHGIARNFPYQDEHALILLKLLLWMDDCLLREGVLPTCYADVFAAPR